MTPTDAALPKTLGVGGEEKQAKLNPRQRYNRWADAEIADLRSKIAGYELALGIEVNETARLTKELARVRSVAKAYGVEESDL